MILVPLVLALSEGTVWGWASAATLGCFAISIVAAVAFVLVEQRVAAPLVDLRLLRNGVLVAATLAILIVAGAINALMYLLSLYFQDPAGFGMSALQAGLATLPAATAMILVTPLITLLAGRIGAGRTIALGFALGAVGFAALVFVGASWSYAVVVLPLVADLRRARHRQRPASSASTSSVSADQVGQASGILPQSTPSATATIEPSAARKSPLPAAVMSLATSVRPSLSGQYVWTISSGGSVRGLGPRAGTLQVLTRGGRCS